MPVIRISLGCALALIFGLELVALAQAPANSLILAKEANGTMTRTAFGLNLTANPTCDQTSEAFPNNSRLVSENLTFNTDGNGLGTVTGTVLLQGPEGKLYQVLTLRGTYGLNLRRNGKQECRTQHLEALLEPVPTFAPVNQPQIALAHLALDLNPLTAGPLPTFTGTLDGVVTLPATLAQRVTINPDKNGYGQADVITAIIYNGARQAISVQDMKSYCSIVKLQRQEGASWTDLGECFLKRATRTAVIGPGETVRVVLSPGENANPLKQPGVYRLLLEYTLGSGTSAATEPVSAASPVFRVSTMPTRQSVQLVLDQPPQYVGQGFVTRVVNDTDLILQTEDHKSECSLLNLQRQEGNTWVNVAQCLLATPTRLIKLEPRQSYEVKLSQEGLLAYPPGRYRLELNYQLLQADGQTLSANTLLYSEEFTLRTRE